MPGSHSFHHWVASNRGWHSKLCPRNAGHARKLYIKYILQLAREGCVEGVTQRSRIRKVCSPGGHRQQSCSAPFCFSQRSEQQPWLHTIRIFKVQQGALSLHKLISSTITPPCTCPSKVSFSGRVNFMQPLNYYALACPQKEDEETYGQESFCPPKRVQENSLIAHNPVL